MVVDPIAGSALETRDAWMGPVFPAPARAWSVVREPVARTAEPVRPMNPFATRGPVRSTAHRRAAASSVDPMVAAAPVGPAAGFMTPARTVNASASPAATGRSAAPMAAGVIAGCATAVRSASTGGVSPVPALPSSVVTMAVACSAGSVRTRTSPTATRISARTSVRPTVRASSAVTTGVAASAASVRTLRTSALTASACASRTATGRPAARTAVEAPAGSAVATPTASKASAPPAAASERSAAMMAVEPPVGPARTRSPGATGGAALRPASPTARTSSAAMTDVGALVAPVTILSQPAFRATVCAPPIAWARIAVMTAAGISAAGVRPGRCVITTSACRAPVTDRSAARTPAASLAVSAAAIRRSAIRDCAAISAFPTVRSDPAGPMDAEGPVASVSGGVTSASPGPVSARRTAKGRPAGRMAAAGSAVCVTSAIASVAPVRSAPAETRSVDSTRAGRAAVLVGRARSAPRAPALRWRSRPPTATERAREPAWRLSCAPWRSAIQTTS